MKCKGKHHSRIFDKATTILLTATSYSVTYPVVLTEIQGVKCQVLTDTGVGASYTLSTLINRINKKPMRTETKKIKTLISTNTRENKIHCVKLQDISCDFGFEMKPIHLQKEVLLELPNPKYREFTHVHLRDLQINDHDAKSDLPVHTILGISDYTK